MAGFRCQGPGAGANLLVGGFSPEVAVCGAVRVPWLVWPASGRGWDGWGFQAGASLLVGGTGFLCGWLWGLGVLGLVPSPGNRPRVPRAGAGQLMDGPGPDRASCGAMVVPGLVLACWWTQPQLGWLAVKLGGPGAGACLLVCETGSCS